MKAIVRRQTVVAAPPSKQRVVVFRSRPGPPGAAGVAVAEAYGESWEGNLTAPTKADLFDYLQSINARLSAVEGEAP